MACDFDYIGTYILKKVWCVSYHLVVYFIVRAMTTQNYAMFKNDEMSYKRLKFWDRNLSAKQIIAKKKLLPGLSTKFFF